MLAPQLQHLYHHKMHASSAFRDVAKLVQAHVPRGFRTILVDGPELISYTLGSGLRMRLPVLVRPFCMSLSSNATLQQEDWVQGEDEERSSSDGRGSSYFSGERLDQLNSSSASPMCSQQSLTGGIDRSSLVSTLGQCLAVRLSYS